MSGMAEIKPEIMKAVQDVITRLRERFVLDAVYIFGSHVTGTPDEYSDIDIAAFAEGVDKLSLPEKIDEIVTVQMKVKAPVEIHLYDSSRLKEARPTNIYGHIIETGSRVL